MQASAKYLRLVFFLSASLGKGQENVDGLIAKELGRLVSVYQSLHANPELSYFEEKTSSFVAKELRSLGIDVTERVGKYRDPNLTCYGVVGVLKNGKGPTVLLRTDLDALPVEEKTGLPYASKVRVKTETGEETSVMHACGHDIHMTCFLGAAKVLTQMKDQWRGTLLFIGQPSEERISGAEAMLRDGLYSRFPKPDYTIALHDDASLEAGKVGMCEGYALASSNSVDITIRGVGGHGAYPHTTKDPVVVAAKVITTLQTIVSRENSPFDPAVVTVGSIHGGTKHNIIPDEVKLQLTVRAYREEVRKNILSSIERITKNIAEAAGVPGDRMPLINFHEDEFTPATYNSPELTRRLEGALQKSLGTENVVRKDPVMGAEDFGRFSLGGSIPICMIWLGAVDPEKVARAKKDGTTLPSLHSPLFAPLPEPTIRTGVKTLMTSVIELMK
ncbi:MAG: amidohydrolase [Ignavibacteriales bacterium]|nr:amidohydrolase [Ignavibacteriales bacterium]